MTFQGGNQSTLVEPLCFERTFIRTRGTLPNLPGRMSHLHCALSFPLTEDCPVVALGSAQPQAAWSVHLAITLCAIVFLMVMGSLRFGIASAADATGRAVESKTSASDIITMGDTHRIYDDCSLGHESAECSPCSSCSADLPSTTRQGSAGTIIVRAPTLQSHHDGVVPSGILRPPRLS